MELSLKLFLVHDQSKINITNFHNYSIECKSYWKIHLLVKWILLLFKIHRSMDEYVLLLEREGLSNNSIRISSFYSCMT